MSSNPTVTLHALPAGHFTLPEWQFIHPVSREARKTVPSLAFLIQHHNPLTSKTTRIVFDLGVRRDVTRYYPPIQKHIETRQPLTTDPDVVKGLEKGGLVPRDIDYVVYSHVHWDHIGEPLDFPTSTFVVGHGALALLDGTSSALRGGHSFFEHDLLPEERTMELSDSNTSTPTTVSNSEDEGTLSLKRGWKKHSTLPKTLDVFGDSSVFIVDAPGHLPGHINLLVHPSSSKSIYLAGDICHDRRLLTGEKEIGTWEDAEGHVCCIHSDRAKAEETIKMVRGLEDRGTEVVLAHDGGWEERNQDRFFGYVDKGLGR